MPGIQRVYGPVKLHGDQDYQVALSDRLRQVGVLLKG